MLPWVYEFKWTAYHLTFLAAFFSVAVVIAITMLRVAWRSKKDFTHGSVDHIRWEVDFEELPHSARACRHEAGHFSPPRECHNSFDCHRCKRHQTEFAATTNRQALRPGTENVYGLSLPLDRYYHRGHTWVLPQEDGTMLVGLDAFAKRMAGTPEEVQLPDAGTRIEQNGTMMTLRRNGASVRILAPISGVIIERADSTNEWTIRVRPLESAQFDHLLRGEEVRRWMSFEVERILPLLTPTSVGLSMADGGELMNDLPSQLPSADWDGVWGEVFLQS